MVYPINGEMRVSINTDEAGAIDQVAQRYKDHANPDPFQIPVIQTLSLSTHFRSFIPEKLLFSVAVRPDGSIVRRAARLRAYL